MASFSARRYAGQFEFVPFDESGAEKPVVIQVRATTKPLMDELNQAIMVATDLEDQLKKAQDANDKRAIIELQPKKTEIVDNQIMIFCPAMTQQWLDDTPFDVKTEMLQEIQLISGLKKLSDGQSRAEREAAQEAALSEDAKKKSSSDSTQSLELLPEESHGSLSDHSES